MKPKQLFNLLLLASLSVSSTCFLAKKASAEIVQTYIKNIQIICDTDTQKCYYNSYKNWLYFGTISDVITHQTRADICRRASMGNQTSAIMASGIDCSSYGYSSSQIQRIEDNAEIYDRIYENLEKLRQ